MKSLHVRRLDNDEIVHSIPVDSPTKRVLEQIILGLLRNMNRDSYYIDDAEFIYGEREG